MNAEKVVHYKIFLCAAGYEPEIRRITIDRDICHNYFYLKQKILAIFPTLKDVAFTISWKDKEEDNVRICTDDELVIALKEMESYDFKKIYVNATPQGKEGPLHPNVICDGCEQPLQGFRYHCIVCPDFDLCPDCERSQLHPEHPMIRIPLPLSAEMPFGRRFSRDLNRMSKHLERLFHQTADYWGDKKAKGDFSCGSKSSPGENRKQHKMKFCPRNEVHNFIHNLVFSQLEKIRTASGGDPSSTANNEPQNSEPQASSSSNDGCPIFEEQKKFVNILTNGLNSFLDPLGIDVIVEEDPVKEESSQKHPEPHQSPSETPGAAAYAQAASSSTPAHVAGPSAVTNMEANPSNAELFSTQVLPVKSPASVAVVAPAPVPVGVSAPSLTNVAPITSAAVAPPVGVQPHVATVGVSATATAVGVPVSAASVGVPVSAAGIGVPVSAASAGVPVPAAGVGVPTVAVPFLSQTNAIPATQFWQPLRPAPAVQSSQEEISVLDPSWTIVNNGMGDSMIVQQPSPTPSLIATPTPSAVSSPALNQRAPESERIYPQLPQLSRASNFSTDEAMMIMQQLGYKDEGWLRLLIETKKGNLQEVLQFLSPIAKPSTNLHH